MMTIMMMMVIIEMLMVIIGMIKIYFLSGMMGVKNGKSRKRKLKKNSYPLFGTHQGIGTGVCQGMRKKRQKNCRDKQDLFVSGDRIQNIF